MITRPEVSVLVASCAFFGSALILSLTMFRLMWREGRRYFGSAGRKNVTHRYKTDKNLCNTNWAMLTSLCSTLMFVAYGTYFMYYYFHYDATDDKRHYKSLTGNVPDIPNTIAVTFRTIAILLVLSHSLWKLNQKYKENDESPVEYYTILCLRFLICLSSIFTCSSIFVEYSYYNKKYWYYTNIAGYSIATFIIFWIGKLFYQRLKECDLEAITEAEILETSQSETRSHESSAIPVISKSGESKIDDLSKQVLLSWFQSVFMIICCISQATMYVYYYCTRKKYHYFQYFAFPIQCITLCLTIILINWCIWLSLDFTHTWYEYICCCHSYVRDSIRKEVKMGKRGTTPIINAGIHQTTIAKVVDHDCNNKNNDYSEPINTIDLKIKAAYRERKRQAYRSIGSAPENDGDFNNSITINPDNDNQSLISNMSSGISIQHFSNIG